MRTSGVVSSAADPPALEGEGRGLTIRAVPAGVTRVCDLLGVVP